MTTSNSFLNKLTNSQTNNFFANKSDNPKIVSNSSKCIRKHGSAGNVHILSRNIVRRICTSSFKDSKIIFEKT